MVGIACYWFPHSNAGDALTPWLVEKISGRKAIYCEPRESVDKLFVCGSILRLAGSRCTAWGTGLPRPSDKVNPAVRCLAVRGPLTAKIVKECGGAAPLALGDPGLFVPRFYSPSRQLPMLPVGLIPHYVDQWKVEQEYGGRDDVRVVNILGRTEQVMEEITACRAVLSSSLHGIIFAAAYGVPVRWAKWSDRICGDGMKFRDFFASVGWQPQKPADLRTHPSLTTNKLVSLAPDREPMNADLEALWQVCPLPKKGCP